MNNDLEQKIRERAYQLWMQDGCPSGQDDEYWYRAEREIRADTGGFLGSGAISDGALGAGAASVDVPGLTGAVSADGDAAIPSAKTASKGRKRAAGSEGVAAAADTSAAGATKRKRTTPSI